MDLQQRKLVKSEWENIEIPISSEEKEILSLMIQGFHNVNIKYNKYLSLFSYLKIEYTEIMEDYLFLHYFHDSFAEMEKKYKFAFFEKMKIPNKNQVVIKKADAIRLEKNTKEKINNANLFEHLLVKMIDSTLKEQSSSSLQQNSYFTLYKILNSTVHHLNKYVIHACKTVLSAFENNIQMFDFIKQSVDLIEKNETILKYADMHLYEHQKQIFTITQNHQFQERLDKYREEIEKKKEREMIDDYNDYEEIELKKRHYRDADAALKKVSPKIVLYIAPTGTGKTLSPIGISEKNRIIFVCAARHVGLSLAKSAISVGKKIAFAFGCSSADDIRLHYFAAKDYTMNKRTGKIGKVDNSVGDKVEIMICDLISYLPAMHYMKAFNPVENIIVYWDEPTITMDYASHDLHEIIHRNWKENVIPNMILSSATLPKLHELGTTIHDFKMKFSGAEVHSIVSHDCKKTIPILNKFGYVVLPHTLSRDYGEISEIVKHSENNLTLLRYMDLREIVDFIVFLEENEFVSSKWKIARHFGCLSDVTMQNIKIHYLKILKNIKTEDWLPIHSYFEKNRKRRIQPNNRVDAKGNTIKKVVSMDSYVNHSMNHSTKNINNGKPIMKIQSEQIITTPQPVSTNEEQSAIYITTKDAYTLTDGPTIFLANDIEKIAKFCIQQANIPSLVMSEITKKIESNNQLNVKISDLEHSLEDYVEKKTMKESMSDNSHEAKKMKSDSKGRDREINVEKDAEYRKMKEELEMFTSAVQSVELNETFIPNKHYHLKKWAPELDSPGKKNSFTSDIDESIIVDIMMLNDVNDSWKILLLMGIGVFTNHTSIAYTEIMKKLAEKQKLYMIIASSDYIYGTNYQFCHGYLSKDMGLTQEKIIQALGRIGRNNIQQDYSIRFRDDEQVMKIFTKEENKPEVANMNRLFCSSELGVFCG